MHAVTHCLIQNECAHGPPHRGSNDTRATHPATIVIFFPVKHSLPPDNIPQWLLIHYAFLN